MEEIAIFNIIPLIARPTAGKSELINYLKGIPLDERRERFHIGKFNEIDDLPMLRSWFTSRKDPLFLLPALGQIFRNYT